LVDDAQIDGSRRLFPALPKVAKNNLLDSLGVTAVNYKDTARLRMFISERGKIRCRRVTGLTAQQHRQQLVRPALMHLLWCHEYHVELDVPLRPSTALEAAR